ncbi:MAG: T9SS type A sorting domain-containing protein [Chitinophagaceae bacterium]
MDGIATPASYLDTLKGNFNAVIANFDTSGKRLWATYFGDSVYNYGGGIYATNSGNVYAVGITQASKNIATDSAYKTTLSGNSDAFIVHIYDSTSAIHLYNTHPYCMNDTFSLGYRITALGSQRNGNIFRAELSNSIGDFTTPTPIGIKASRLSGMVFCTLPTGITGTGYKIRVYATLPRLMSDTIAITINPYPQPVITKTGNTLSTGTFDSYQWYLNGVAIAGATGKNFQATANGSYTVKVSSGGCVNTSVAFNATNVGIYQIVTVEDIQVYPNPAKNQVIIEDAPAGTSLKITNVVGQIMGSYILNQKLEMIPLNTYPNGIYQFSFEVKEGGKKTVKIVKE